MTGAEDRPRVYVTERREQGDFIDFHTGKVKIREDPDQSKFLADLYSSPDLMLDVDAETVGSSARYIADTRIARKSVNAGLYMCWNACDELPCVVVFADEDIETGEEVVV